MRRRLPAVPAGRVVDAQHDDVYIEGDVAGAVLVRSAVVAGNVLPGGGILAKGGGATIIIGGSCSPDARLVAEGGGAEVIVMGSLR